MMKQYMLLLLLCLSPVICQHATGQKVYKNIKTALKNKKAAEALSEVRKLQADSLHNGDPRLYYYGVQASIMQNRALNEKIYLKQPYDTLLFFNSVYEICDYALKCDSVERILLAGQGKPLKFQWQHTPLLHKYYRNLVAGSRYFYVRRKYAEAVRFLSFALDLPQQLLWGNDHSDVNRKEFVKTAVLNIHSAYLLRDYEVVKEYADIALRDTTSTRSSVIEYLARTAAETADTTAWLDYLRLGLKEFPGNMYFFTELSDYYTQHGDYAASLTLVDNLLPADTANATLLTAKSVALMNLGRNEESIEYSLRALAIDSTLSESYYYVGAAYCNLANAVELPVSINSKAYKTAMNQRQSYFREALPYLKTYREREPKGQTRWAPLLYNVYLSLNMGKEFDEIERITKQLKP